MKFLLNIALGKSIYTLYFFIVMAVSIALALLLKNILIINFSLVLVCILGVFIMISAVVSTSEAVESLKWPKVNAKLGISKVSTHSVGNIGSESYYPTVQYSFEIDGQNYSGNTYTLGERTYSRPAVEKIIQTVQSHKDTLAISYNPTDPSINVVKPGINGVHYIRALVGISITGITILELCGWVNFI